MKNKADLQTAIHVPPTDADALRICSAVEEYNFAEVRSNLSALCKDLGYYQTLRSEYSSEEVEDDDDAQASLDDLKVKFAPAIAKGISQALKLPKTKENFVVELVKGRIQEIGEDYLSDFL
jgi:hypothetical protein